jgi:hypothetical protein
VTFVNHATTQSESLSAQLLSEGVDANHANLFVGGMGTAQKLSSGGFSLPANQLFIPNAVTGNWRLGWIKVVTGSTFPIDVTVTVHLAPRGGNFPPGCATGCAYNTAGESFQDAQLVTNDDTIHLTMRNNGVPNAYNEVFLKPGGQLSVSGDVTNASNASMGFEAFIYDTPTHQMARIVNMTGTNSVPPNSTGSITSSTSSTFTNTGTTTAIYYIVWQHTAANAGYLMSGSNLTIHADTAKLTLYLLDEGQTFDPMNPSNFASDFVPGSWPDGISRAVPTAFQPIQTVKVVAAFVDESGSIVQPPSGNSVSFSLENTSAYKGIAMNMLDPAGDEYDDLPDFELASNAASFTNLTATVDLKVWDYGGFTTVVASDPASPTARMQLPKDVDNNMIPDVGWVADDFQAIADDESENNDTDGAPSGRTGTQGDGLSRREEYRGFIVNGGHHRTNPARKNLFISSPLLSGFGDSTNLCDPPSGSGACLEVEYPLLTSEFYFYVDSSAQPIKERRIINPYFQNAGDGGTPAHYEQAVLELMNGGFDCAGIDPQTGLCNSVNVGSTPFGTNPLGPPMNVIGRISIFLDSIRYASPPNIGNPTLSDPVDLEKEFQTVGHEIGHSVGIAHWTFSQDPNRPPTVMVTIDYFSMPNAWANIPHSYDAIDQSQLILR